MKGGTSLLGSDNMKVKNLTSGTLMDTKTGLVFQREQVLEVPYEFEERMRELARANLIEILEDSAKAVQEAPAVEVVPVVEDNSPEVEVNELIPERPTEVQPVEELNENAPNENELQEDEPKESEPQEKKRQKKNK